MDIIKGKTYYEVLGLDQNCSSADIKRAYHLLARKYHPDVTLMEKSYASYMMGALSEAYNVLSDPVKRAEYDDFLVNHVKTIVSDSCSGSKAGVVKKVHEDFISKFFYYTFFAFSKIKEWYKRYPSTVRYAFGLLFLIFFDLFYGCSFSRQIDKVQSPISKPAINYIKDADKKVSFYSFTGLPVGTTYTSLKHHFPNLVLEPAGYQHNINRYNCVLPVVPFEGFPSHSDVLGFDDNSQIKMVSYKFLPENFGQVRNYFYAALGPFVKHNDMYIFEADNYRVVLLSFGSDGSASVSFFIK